MKFVPFACCLSLLFVVAGCNETSTASGDPAADDSQQSESTDNRPATASEEEAESGTEAELMGRKVDLTPANTSIEFVGVHTDPDKPEPRHGRFQQFSGTAMVDQTLMSVQVDIQTASLKTEIDKLTNHLKDKDFFHVNQFPNARFESTKIVEKEDGNVEITGDLTLLNETNSVTFPATVDAEGDLELKAEFDIDRTRWGMDYGTDNIKKMVTLKIKIGKN